MTPGEALDRLSILTVKTEHLRGTPKGAMAEQQLVDLQSRCDQFFPRGATTFEALLVVNGKLWAVEDEVRELLAKLPGLTEVAMSSSKCELDVTKFALVAARVPILNDERAQIKRDFDILSNSSVVEVKSYV